MGRVFLGLSAGGRRVAVKVIRSELAADPDFRVRFRREVAAARKVSGLFTTTGRCPSPRSSRWPPGWQKAWPRSTPPVSCTVT